MTRSPSTFLRLSRSGRWVPSSRSYNLDRHPRPPLFPASSSPSAPLAPPHFETLASSTTPVSSVQAPTFQEGSRTGQPVAGKVSVEEPGEQASRDQEEAATGKRVYLGLELPVKPSPPAEGECCMSGCAHCVYDLYLDDMEHFHSLVSSARSVVLARLRALNPAEHARERERWPVDHLGKLEEAEGEEGKGKGEKEDIAKAKAEKELDRTRKELDPGMRAFLEMEARMKKKQKEKGSQARPAGDLGNSPALPPSTSAAP
ncbi:hypothetical protein JCM21900_005868 [Sporobolomyces salmonicolor]